MNLREDLAELLRVALEKVPETGGLDEARLRATEDRLGRKLPASLWTFYGVAGQVVPVMESYHAFVSADALRCEGDALILCRGHQSQAAWAIPSLQLHEADPPVVQRDHDSAPWRSHSNACSLFLVNMTCWQLVNSMPSMGSTDIGIGTVSRLRKRLRVVGAAFGCDMMSFVNAGRGLLGCALLEQNRLYLSARDDDSLRHLESEVGVELDWA